MTITDRLIPFYVWFVFGFGIIAILIGIVNFGMNLVTMFTVKGIYMPFWIIPIAVTALVIFCTSIGWFFEKYDIWNRITSHQNRRMNPEIRQMAEDIKEIRNLLEEKHKGK
ncbi:MAG TPA: hypothetical protein P5217_00400 [Methanoregulaceae archaeon]|nr:hypothetical protein [Methanoregulaceae archaeon]HPD75715.1 hypothetical protein [Methanoregulaceae archaeon]HRY74723.1 hypothetical protein [Methanoregulaceae archaeon]